MRLFRADMNSHWKTEIVITIIIVAGYLLMLSVMNSR